MKKRVVLLLRHFPFGDWAPGYSAVCLARATPGEGGALLRVCQVPQGPDSAVQSRRASQRDEPHRLRACLPLFLGKREREASFLSSVGFTPPVAHVGRVLRLPKCRGLAFFHGPSIAVAPDTPLPIPRVRHFTHLQASESSTVVLPGRRQCYQRCSRSSTLLTLCELNQVRLSVDFFRRKLRTAVREQGGGSEGVVQGQGHDL